jgi:GTPase SAR1 and related small G proteins
MEYSFVSHPLHAGPGSCFADAVGVTYKVLFLGLDGAGKTTICLRMMDRGNEIPVRTGMETAIYDNKMAKERCCVLFHDIRTFHAHCISRKSTEENCN